MELTSIILLALSALLFGLVSGYILRWLISLSQRNSIEISVKQTLFAAKSEAQKIITEAKNKAEEYKISSQVSCDARETELRVLEERLHNKDQMLDSRQIETASELQRLKDRDVKLEESERQIKNRRATLSRELQTIANLNEQEAKTLLLDKIKKEHEEDIVAHITKLKREGKQRTEHNAKALLASAVQRMAATQAEPLLTTAITLPSEETKGKIIGKEGRNVKAFERASGVDLVIDETPLTITISCFDPVRRHIARTALDRLIEDGRIHPAKIEETILKVKGEVKELISAKGEEGAYEVGAFNLDPKLISLLGRLYFRTSYGQNVLAHSIEMAHIGAILAEELDADVQTVKTASLLHDIGKAVDHDIAGTHVEIGRRLLQKFNVHQDIIRAMQSHHEEYPYETLEAVIVQTADAISAGRPGARRDSAPQYIKRLTDLEAVATDFEGVRDAFAVQAGRELRVFVDPEIVSDIDALAMSRQIATRIESEIAYPGEIKIIIIREHRTIEFAR
ncbi:MAG: ribonuclease Y [bacterium]|nr:ribonuclease Y [bacterium]